MALDNRISLHKLEVFCSVVDEGGVGAAASSLRVTQPVVTAHVRSLEEKLGAPLFVRAGRGLEMTDAGSAVYRWAKGVLRSRIVLDEELRGITAGNVGSVSIAASMSVGSYVLPRPLAAFRRNHPGADIQLHISDVETSIQQARSGMVDFCIVTLENPLGPEDLVIHYLGEQRYAVVTSADDSDTPDVVTPDKLAKLDFVAPPRDLAIRRAQDLALATIGIRSRRVVQELGSAEALKAAVQEGLGVSLLAHTSVSEDIQSGRLREIRVDGLELSNSLYAVRRTDATFSPVVSATWEYLLDVVHQLLESRYR